MFKKSITDKNTEKDKMLKSSKQFIYYFFSQCEFLASAEADNEKEAITDVIAQNIDTRLIDFKLVCNRKNDSYYSEYCHIKKPKRRLYNKRNRATSQKVN